MTDWLSGGTDATAPGIISLADLKAYLGISGSGEDTILNFIVDGVNEAIVAFCGRSFNRATYTEYHDGSGGLDAVHVRARPLVSVTSCYLSSNYYGGSNNSGAFPAETLLTENSDFIVDLNRSAVVLINRPWPMGVKNIKLVIVAGYSTMPDDLVLAALQLAAQVRADATSDAGAAVESEKLGDYSYKLLRSDGNSMIAGIRRVLTRYRVPAL